MLLEVSRPRHLIVGRAPISLADRAIWECLSRFRIVILFEPADAHAWEPVANHLEFVQLLEYDDSLAYEVQANIRRALELVDAEPYNSIYVTFRAGQELQDAVNTRLGTIQAGGAIADVMPDVFLRMFPGDLAEVENEAGLRRLGYLAEALALVADGLAPGAGGQIISQPHFFRRQLHIHDGEQIQDVELILLGRYFPSSDVRHDKHQLTRRLLKAKDLDQKGAVLARALGGALHLIA